MREKRYQRQHGTQPSSTMILHAGISVFRQVFQRGLSYVHPVSTMLTTTTTMKPISLPHSSLLLTVTHCNDIPNTTQHPRTCTRHRHSPPVANDTCSLPRKSHIDRKIVSYRITQRESWMFNYRFLITTRYTMIVIDFSPFFRWLKNNSKYSRLSLSTVFPDSWWFFRSRYMIL